MKKNHGYDGYELGHEDGFEAGYIDGYKDCLRDLSQTVIDGLDFTDALVAGLQKAGEIERLGTENCG